MDVLGNGPLPMIKLLIAPRRAAGLSAALAVVLFCIIQPSAARGYVLEAPHILELTAKAMGRVPTLELRQKRLIYASTPDTFPTAVDEVARIVMPRRFRSDIVSDQMQRTYLEVGKRSLSVIDGRISRARESFDLYQRVLRNRSRQGLMKTLNRLGLETAISSLGRIEGRVVCVVGARYPDESVSQLAVDHDSFLPVRLLLAEKPADGPPRQVAIYYDDWKKIQDGQFPYRVTFYVDGVLTREIRVVQVRVNPKLQEGLMDLEALKASAVVTDTAPPRDVPGLIQQEAETAKKKIE